MAERFQRGVVKVDLCIGVAVAALGGVLAAGLGDISFGAGYDRIGPRFFPSLVAFGLMLLGGWFVAAAFLRAAPAPVPAPQEAALAAEEAPPRNSPAGFYLAAALALTVALLDRLGFVLACAAQFWLVARAFGSRRALRDALVGCGLSLACYLAFANGLGLTLPAGILEGIL